MPLLLVTLINNNTELSSIITRMEAFSVTAVYAQQHSPNPSIGQTPTGCTQQQHMLPQFCVTGSNTHHITPTFIPTSYTHQKHMHLTFCCNWLHTQDTWRKGRDRPIGASRQTDSQTADFEVYLRSIKVRELLLPRALIIHAVSCFSLESASDKDSSTCKKYK